jgi:NAD(P)-dependent dehydrogenase (short-subunit alcohol dehydrogenase family)
LGYETAKQLLLKGAKVYIAARSPDKAAEAIKRLRAETQAAEDRVLFVKLDLADLRSVRAGATDFLAREERLDILFNNGLVDRKFDNRLLSDFLCRGVMTTPPDLLTTQNFDLRASSDSQSNVCSHLFSRIRDECSWPLLLHRTSCGSPLFTFSRLD